MTVSEALQGSRVRRVASLGSRAILLELSAPKGTLVLSVERGAQGIAFVDRTARQIALEPAPWVSTLHSMLEGAQLGVFERIGTRGSRLQLTRGVEQLWLVLEWSHGGAWALLRANTETAGTEPQLLQQVGRVHTDPPETPEPYEPAADLAELQADGARLVPLLAALELEAHKRALTKRLRTERERRKRRLTAIEQDAARVADADALRAQASLVLANLHALRGVSGEIELDDYTSDPPSRRTVTIDPKLGARAQCDAWFQRARKLERGAVLAKERAATTQTELRELTALIERATAAVVLAELAPVQDQARRFGIAPQAPNERKNKQAERVPYREFRGTGERVILVGRGAADNDALTLRHAKPHDLWLHARDESGAHVVVPLTRNESCPPELLCDAATLAAHFSSARGAERTDVIYTPRRYVQKPRKSAVGAVLVLREKVFHLQLEPARLKGLLASEQAPDAR
jgi:predicted ribosome quality control (RQC) complex YloA/Tae2 family protein